MSTSTPLVDVVVPVYNEAGDLEWSITTLRRYLDDEFPLPSRVVIADNASTDGTWLVACRLAETLEGVSAFHIDQKGRGGALRAAWTASDASVVAYMDVDLSTDLSSLVALVAPLLAGASDVGIGSRLARGAEVVRGRRRGVLSRGYNVLVHLAVGNRFSDAQCGFKALRREVACQLLPEVLDDGWFFDTELLALAAYDGYRIHEVPVHWVEDTDSRVRLIPTIVADLRGLWRVNRSLRRRRVAVRGTIFPKAAAAASQPVDGGGGVQGEGVPAVASAWCLPSRAASPADPLAS